MPRTVHESSNLVCPPEHQAGYSVLKGKMAKGDDVNSHLSKTILSDNFEDYLLNDWGIHHFHLGENVHKGFAERTGPLLFALVKESDVYFINVLAHGAWSEQELIRMLHNEWPESIVNYRLKGVLGLAGQPTNEDIEQLRKVGVQTMVQIEDGVVYGPIGGGYSTAGTSVQSRMLANRHHQLVRDIEKYVRKNSNMYIDKIKHLGLTPGSKPHFQLFVDDKGFHVVEFESRVAFLVHPHNQV